MEELQQKSSVFELSFKKPVLAAMWGEDFRGSRGEVRELEERPLWPRGGGKQWSDLGYHLMTGFANVPDEGKRILKHVFWDLGLPPVSYLFESYFSEKIT